jgi:hypothetical protein
VDHQPVVPVQMKVAGESQSGDGTTASYSEESASDSSDCPDDPNYCPTEYEGSAMPGTVDMLDATGSDESLRDQASSGFDKPGIIVIEEGPAVYEDEDSVTILIPVDSPPEEVKEAEEEEGEELGSRWDCRLR